MNSFFVPQLGSQIYTMAGMTSQLSLQADEPGTYPRPLGAIQRRKASPTCVSTCRPLPRDAYAKWVADAKATGAALDRAAYAELVKPSKNVSPTTYRSVEPGLFDAIVEWTGAAAAGVAPADARARRSAPATQGKLMLGKLTWSAIPFDQPIPLVDVDRGDRRHPRRARLGHAQGLLALSLARMDHFGRSQAHRRHVLRARARDAGPRLRRRDHDARAAGAGLSSPAAICRPSITTRSSPRTARS